MAREDGGRAGKYAYREAAGITGVILAGGENRRFPVLKGFVKVDGTEIIRKTLGLFREIFHPVFISANIPEAYFHLGVPLIGDALPSKGPVSGIYSSLLNAPGASVFVSACDMPFLQKEVMLLVCSEYQRLSPQGGVDAVVPVYDGKAEPLLALYARPVLPHLEDAIRDGKTSLRRLLDRVRTHFIDEREIRARDPQGRSFVNINTWEEYESVIRR